MGERDGDRTGELDAASSRSHGAGAHCRRLPRGRRRSGRMYIVAGLQTRVAGGCAEALEIIRHWSLDVVLLDLMMPQRDGFATARAIRGNPNSATTFICAYTSKDGEFVARNRRRCLDGYFRKGASPYRLLSFLRCLCVSHELQ